MKSIPILTTLIILLGVPASVYAIPQLLNHQGYMSNNQGIPVGGSANVTFDLYTVEAEGESLWTQTISVTFDGGYYSVVLGPGTPELSITLFDGSELFLGTTIEGQNEFMPRMRIASVPYAFRANAVEGEVKAVGGLVVDGVEVINDQQQWVGTNVSFNNLDDVPSDLADGDDIGLEGSGTGGNLAKFTESGLGDSVMVEVDGKVGLGVSEPQSSFHVSGGIQLTDDTDECGSNKEGTMRWHEDKVEVCDGTEWGPIVAACPIGQSQSMPGANCKAILDSGTSQGDEMYWIDPNGGSTGDAFQAYCDMTTDGGGWTMVVFIDGNDEDHSNTGQVGSLPITPTDSTTKKLSDSVINSLRSDPDQADIRFICDGTKHFFKDCNFGATQGLESNEQSCWRAYSNQEATNWQYDGYCNCGSGGLGSHCSSPSPAAHNYCSHCDRGECSGSHERKGCGHDSTGYSKAGSVWVR